MKISSRTKLMKDAEKLLNVIKEETEGVDSKVETAVKKMKEMCIEKQDKTSALIELAKLVDDNNYKSILGSIKDVEKVYEKFEDGIALDTHYLMLYRDSIQALLFNSTRERFNNKEFALIASCFWE